MMLRLAIAAVLAFLPVAGKDPHRGGQLRFAIQSEPKSLDPLLASDEPSEMIRYFTHAPLIRLNRATQSLEPALASSWKTTQQGRKITLELRTGVQFSDGTPFRAADVCATFRRLMDPKLESPLADQFAFDKGKMECVVEGEQRVSLTFPEAKAGLERLLDTVPVLSEKGASAGLGPFVIAERKPGAYFILQRNPRYWKRDARGVQLPYLDYVRVEIQHNKEFEMLRFGEAEYQLVNNLDADLFERLKQQKPAEALDLGPSLDTEQIWFNQAARSPLPAYKKAWYASREFRQAVSLAIRRDDLAKVVYRGHATPAYGPVSPSNRAWYWAGPRPPANPEAAIALLRKAGFKLTGRVLQDANGQPVEFSIITNAGNKSRERMASMIQQDLAEIGIRVTVAPLDMPSVLDRIGKSLNYDACLLGFIHSDPDPNEQLNVLLSSSGMHAWDPAQAKPATVWEGKVDELMLRQAAALDPSQRRAAFVEVQRIIAEQAPMVYLVHRNTLAALSPVVRNVQPSVLRPNLLWNIEQVSVGAPVQ
jgi:peptide/nickel transport system substrate-binding protein